MNHDAGSRPFAVGVLLAATIGGVGCAGRIPLPGHLTGTTASMLLDRMAEARSAVSSYTAEARIAYFGARGRLKVTASLAASRPDSVRYDLLGPHGGVVSAFAMSKGELQLADFRSSRFLYGPATEHNIDSLMGLVPLGLDPAGLTSLLFGEVVVPRDANLAYDDRAGRFVLTWSVGEQLRRVEVDPRTSRLTRALIERRGGVVSEVLVVSRDAVGLPGVLRVRAPAQRTDVEVKLRDVEHGAALAASAYVLEPPSNMAREYVGSPTSR